MNYYKVFQSNSELANEASFADCYALGMPCISESVLQAGHHTHHHLYVYLRNETPYHMIAWKVL